MTLQVSIEASVIFVQNLSDGCYLHPDGHWIPGRIARGSLNLQSSPLRIKRAFSFYGDDMGQILTEDGRSIRRKDSHERRFKRRNGRKPRRPR